VAIAALTVAGCSSMPPIFGCPESTPVTVGDWWVEIGGPNAQFNIEPDTLRPGPNAWLVTARIVPDPGDIRDVAVRIERLDGPERNDVFVNSRVDPANLFHNDVRAPQLPGGWFLLEVPIETAGCWQIIATVNGVPAGSAVFDVAGP
jgi:hypothetical protein